MKRQYDFDIKACKVFATANELSRLSKPLQSRIRLLHLPPYTEDLFIRVCIRVLPKLREITAHMIGEKLQALSIAMQAYNMNLELLSSATVVERAVDFVEKHRGLGPENVF